MDYYFVIYILRIPTKYITKSPQQYSLIKYNNDNTNKKTLLNNGCSAPDVSQYMSQYITVIALVIT